MSPLLILAKLAVERRWQGLPVSDGYMFTKGISKQFSHLIKMGADVTATDEDGRTALHIITIILDSDMVSNRYLEENSWTTALGGPVFEYFVTPLILNGADVWATDTNGITPLELVRRRPSMYEPTQPQKKFFDIYLSLFTAIWLSKGVATGKYGTYVSAFDDLARTIGNRHVAGVEAEAYRRGQDAVYSHAVEIAGWSKAVRAMISGPWGAGTANVVDTEAERDALVEFPTGVSDGYEFMAGNGRYYTYSGGGWVRT